MEKLRVGSYRRRLVDNSLERNLKVFPAVMLIGPRASGKTTTALQHASQIIRLDQPSQAEAFRLDPDAALRDTKAPLLLDEWQEVPEILGAVKRYVDTDPTPGRFILTGSVRTDLEAASWPGTGRIKRLYMYGMTQKELRAQLHTEPKDGSAELTFLEKAAAAKPELFTLPATTPDLRDCVELATVGGFPTAAITAESHFASDWNDGYLDQLLTRDAQEIDSGTDSGRLAAYFEAIAANSAGVIQHKTLYDAANISRNTAMHYDYLLEALYVCEQIPAWSANHLSRLTRTPKRYITDPALMAAALNADVTSVLADGDLLGRIIDTFVMSQLRPETALASRTRTNHLRTKNGREEVDLVIELPGHKLIGIEIKASATPKSNNARHLRWLKDKHGDNFVCGIVLHTGPNVLVFDEQIFAVPICAFWG